LKKQSISASTRQLIRKYLGNKQARRFIHFYDIRSGLLHDGTLRCDEPAFGNKVNELTNMVSGLLVKMIKSKTTNYPSEP
jgi:hypothetical protein